MENVSKPSTVTSVTVLKASTERSASMVRKHAEAVWPCVCFDRVGELSCPLCLAVVQCSREEVTIPSKGSVNCTHTYGEFSYDSRCHYSCEEGYQLNSSSPLTCEASGQWSEQPPTCNCELGEAYFQDRFGVHIFLPHIIMAILLFSVVTCPKVSPPTNGAVACTDPLAFSSYQSSCVFTCDEGYTLIGSNSLQCQASGIWNSSQPFCAGMSEQVSTTLPLTAHEFYFFVKHIQK